MSCEFCKKADFGNYSAKVDKYSASIYLAGGSSRFPKDEQFKFCPECGEPLTEPVPLALEQLRKMDGQPIWVVDIQKMPHEIFACIVVIDEPCENFCAHPLNFGSRQFCFSQYNKRWLAYTHKPMED